MIIGNTAGKHRCTGDLRLVQVSGFKGNQPAILNSKAADPKKAGYVLQQFSPACQPPSGDASQGRGQLQGDLPFLPEPFRQGLGFSSFLFQILL